MAAVASHCYDPAGAYCRRIQSRPTPAGKRGKKLLCRSYRFCDLLYLEWIGPDLGGARHDRKNAGGVVALRFNVPGCFCSARAGFPPESVCATMNVINRYLAVASLDGSGDRDGGTIAALRFSRFAGSA